MSPARGRAAAAAASAVLLGLAAAGCSSGSGASGADTGSGAAKTVRKLGRVPIPSAPAAPAEPTASPGHAQLVAMGDPVRVVLGGGAGGGAGRVAALGPDFAAGTDMDRRAGSVTVRSYRTDAGREPRLCASELTFHDELGRVVPTHPVGPACGTRVVLAGTFESGHATLTWRYSGRPLVTWDFQVELD